ncbi:hypothetical protein CR956_00385 [Candidatus Saccharibacteria bacterium]|nr:MAG: hypothetical protein CR956_00385 [Candidatus Saccharibacteria bacterium]
MIIEHQPTCFPDNLIVKVSSRDDGTMLERTIAYNTPKALENRRSFAKKVGLNYDDLSIMRIDYSPDATYSLISEIDTRHASPKRLEVLADAIILTTPGTGIFLPLADCIGTIIYDPASQLTVVLHMGRHSTLTNLLEKTIGYLASRKVDPKDLIVWMTPSAGKDSYAMEYFDYKHQDDWKDFCNLKDGKIYLDLPSYNRQRLLGLGLNSENIHISPVDTVTDQNYFSHSAGEVDGRFGLLVARR